MHISVFRRLYAYDDFYDVISDGLSALISLDVDNVPDAVRELRNFCSRSHHSSSLCDYCSVTKTFLERVGNEAYPFYRLHSASARFFPSPISDRIFDRSMIFLFIFLVVEYP